MTFRRHILVLLMALFGLMAPSFAAGVGAVTASTAAPAVTLSVATGHSVPVYSPCEKQGGKRALPCHPDLGILAAAVAATDWAPALRRDLAADPVRRLPAPTADPPPPRRA